MYSYFNMDHWRAVKKARQEQGLNRLDVKLRRTNHPMVGVQLVHKATNLVYTVESVSEDWLYGRFLTARLELQGSHRVCVIENISCSDTGVQAQLDIFQEEFAILN